MHLISDVQISVVVNASSTDSVAFPQQYTNIALDAKLTTVQVHDSVQIVHSINNIHTISYN